MAKGWDWLENAYDVVKPWAHTALKIGEMVAPLLMEERKTGDTATFKVRIENSIQYLKGLGVYNTTCELL